MRKALLVLIGCLVLCAAPAWAGGEFSLFGTYGEVTEANRSFGFGARVSVGGESVMVDLAGTWFPARSAGDFDEDLQVIPFDLGLRLLFAPGSDVRPYVGAGATYMAINLSDREVDDPTGYYLLAGFSFKAGKTTAVFCELIYREADATVDEGSPSEFEATVGGVAGSIGFYWKF
jgi:hypothetical protein